MNLNIVLPLASSLLAFVFALLLFDQWRDRRRPYQLIWAIGMLWFGISTGAEFLGGAFGWNEALYKTWYLIGAIFAAGWLGLGTIYLLRLTRFGYAVALALVLAGLFTVLTQARFQYANTGLAPLIYLGVAIALAVDVVALTYLKSPRWADVTAAVVIGGSVIAAILMLFAQVPAPGYFLDARGIPVADGLPGYLRLLSPIFSVAGALSLILGAVYSAYIYMPKVRVIHFTLSASQSGPAFLASLLVAVVAVPVNFVASLPRAMADLFRGRINSRVPAMILIALGATIEAVSNGLTRFGDTGAVFFGEFLGLVFLFLGYLVSIEVMPTIRVPFTRFVLLERRVEA